MINLPELRRSGKDLHNIGPVLSTYCLRAESLESRHMLAADLTFADPVLFDVDIVPEHVLVADLDADGRADLVSANYASSNISVLLGKGDGTFHSQMRYDVGVGPVETVAADFDGDSILDLAVANLEGSSVSILLGIGIGTFERAIEYSAGVWGAIGVDTGDFDGDGNLDLVVVHVGTPEDLGGVSVLMGRGGGDFAPAVEYFDQLRPVAVKVAELSGDGKLDLVLANGFFFSDDYDVAVLLGAADGTFPSLERYATRIKPVEVLVGDFNSDGHSDLAACSPREVWVFLGAGDGYFFTASIYPLLVAGAEVELASGDMNA